MSELPRNHAVSTITSTILKTKSLTSLRSALDAEKRDKLTIGEFKALCVDNGINESEAVSVAKSLHNAGVIVHFDNVSDPLISESVFIKPQSIISGFSQLLDPTGAAAAAKAAAVKEKVADIEKVSPCVPVSD